MGPRSSARPVRSTATNQGRRSRFTTGTGTHSEADFHPPGVPIAVFAASGHILMALDRLSRWRRSVVLSRSPQTCEARGRRFRGDSTNTAQAGSTGLQAREEVRNGKGGTLRPIRKGASRRRRLHGILHRAGVTEMTSPAKSLTCGVLVSRSAIGLTLIAQMSAPKGMSRSRCAHRGACLWLSLAHTK